MITDIYVEGITLKTYIEKKQQLSYKEAISIAVHESIAGLFRRRIMHRTHDIGMNRVGRSRPGDAETCPDGPGQRFCSDRQCGEPGKDDRDPRG